jgi:uncharacterized membrane protein YdjX (TVP38/TMEM64 family)
MKMRSGKHPYVYALLGLIFLIAVGSYFFREYFDTFGIFGSRDDLEIFIGQFGALAPFIFVSLITLEVFFAPLPGDLFPVVGGVVFGPASGILYAWIGNVFGALLAFYVARRFGLKVISFFIPSFKKNHVHYSNEIELHKHALWVLYSIPLIPVDIISFAIGISKINLRTFLGAIMIAFLIRVSVWVFFGDALGRMLFIQ